jgi:dimethylglycine dehydrogenase
VTFEVDAKGADASGYEPIWRDGRRVGFVTSGGYGHTVGRSLAMGLVEPSSAQEGLALSMHIIGVERRAVIITPSPHDPEGTRMKA